MINEKLGIPDNIIESAKKIWDETIISFNSSYNEDPTVTKQSFDYIVKDLEISDFKIKSVYITFRITKTDRMSEPKLAGMAVSTAVKGGEIKKILYDIKDDLRFLVDVYVNTNNTKDEILNSIKHDEKIKFISSFAHELKHSYDHKNKPEESIKSQLDYININDHNLGVDTLNEFMYMVYYTHSTENIVRATEVGADIKHSGIDKSEFEEYLKKNDVYKKLDNMSKYTITDFYNGLVKDMDDIIYILRSMEKKIGSNEENIKEILGMVLLHTMNTKMDNFSKHVARINPLMLIFGGDDNDVKEIFDDIRKSIEKYEKNPIKFFENQIKYINFVGNKYKRKIVKLYDLIEDEPNIVHNSINKRVLNFKKFNDGKK